MKSGDGCRRFEALWIKKCKAMASTLNEVVGNGFDRSGIGVFTAILYKIRIEYNT
ncbi:MAG: hypothetical protein ACI4F2_03380 [Acutalibacteraceae bacterium]